MKKVSPRTILDFQQKIFTWVEENQRDFPRRRTTNPYEILVSEIMLQQTQTYRVVHFFSSFIKRFPTIHDLAQANTRDVLEQRFGLGFNSRALRLQKIAQSAVNFFDGKLPNRVEDLKQLPGVGPYTAHAILAFAYNLDVPVIDVNIKRIYMYEFGVAEKMKQQDRENFVFQFVPVGRSRQRHNALMDYGALELTAKKTGIKLGKPQGTFEGSTRQTRAKILKHFLHTHHETIVELKNKFPHQEFDKILQKMNDEGIINIVNSTVTLA